ncbi:manganese efflux pump MntP [Methanoculleus bourgensis]|uniref:Manganese efflux pump MntP n=1 Tax=Methanoculleus bourgensis TaxID=83986 RepID=A0A0X3BHA6_9EURY|nr:hypothetical protein [Methanoculleus bourgensis]CVK31508.1 exported protein of unknown function [Methanoculleus bourgensis]
MEFATTLLIAVGLAMDAFAVAISGGATVREDRARYAIIVGALFGGFQAGMPVLGWLGGASLASSRGCRCSGGSAGRVSPRPSGSTTTGSRFCCLP